jgi:hypothetical protein
LNQSRGCNRGYPLVTRRTPRKRQSRWWGVDVFGARRARARVVAHPGTTRGQKNVYLSLSRGRNREYPLVTRHTPARRQSRRRDAIDARRARARAVAHPGIKKMRWILRFDPVTRKQPRLSAGHEADALAGHEVTASWKEEGLYFRLVDVCITQL